MAGWEESLCIPRVGNWRYVILIVLAVRWFPLFTWVLFNMTTCRSNRYASSAMPLAELRVGDTWMKHNKPVHYILLFRE